MKNYSFTTITLSCIFALSSVFTLSASGKEASVSMAGHPRLLVTKEEIPLLKERFKHADFYEMRQVLKAQRNYKTDGKVTKDIPNDSIRQKMEALALEYLLDSSKKKSGLSAITLATDYLSSYTDLRKAVQKGYTENLQTYEAIFGAALVYDWCYDLMTDKNKAELVDLMKKTCALGEYGLPSGKEQYLSGHYGEYAPTIYLAMGIAIFDEDPSMFQFAYKEQTEGFAPSRNPMFASKTHHQGAQYIHVRGYHEMMQHFILNKLKISPYDANISKMVYRDIYGAIPQKTDMDGMPEGDGHNNLMMGNPQIYYLSANLSADPYLQTMSRKYLMKNQHQCARMFILHNPDIASAAINDLQLTKYFPSPSGIMIARTAWDIDKTGYESDAMVVLMNMKEYNTQNHTHMDEGHFGIYYKGHQALDAGIYQGKDANNGWGKENYVNYYSRTIAHNSLLVYDPNEPTPYAGWKIKSTARDGGQFFYAHHAWDNAKDMFAAGKSAEVLAVDIQDDKAPEYSYMKGDITPSYCVPPYVDPSYPAKVDTVRRSFVFLNHKSGEIPGTLIVLDRVVARKSNFKKTWLLHTQNQPEVNNNIVTAKNTNKKRNGKLQNTVLLPESNNLIVETIGGEGKEYWADGKNWGTVSQEDAGKWRVEVSPKDPQLADNFLNVIQLMRADSKMPYDQINKSMSSSGNYVAISIKDRIVAQSLYLNASASEIKFNIGEADTLYKVLVTDLETGIWIADTLGGTKKIFVGKQGTAYFDSFGGAFSLRKKVN